MAAEGRHPRLGCAPGLHPAQRPISVVTAAACRRQNGTPPIPKIQDTPHLASSFHICRHGTARRNVGWQVGRTAHAQKRQNTTSVPRACPSGTPVMKSARMGRPRPRRMRRQRLTNNTTGTRRWGGSSHPPALEPPRRAPIGEYAAWQVKWQRRNGGVVQQRVAAVRRHSSGPAACQAAPAEMSSAACPARHWRGCRITWGNAGIPTGGPTGVHRPNVSLYRFRGRYPPPAPHATTNNGPPWSPPPPASGSGRRTPAARRRGGGGVGVGARVWGWGGWARWWAGEGSKG